VDEWRSVGDASFSEKASKGLESLVEQSSDFIIASYSPELISRLCNRGMRLHRGRLQEEFAP